MSAAEWETMRLSLFVSAMAVAVSLPLGVGLGWLLARRSFWGKMAIETLVTLPLVLPPVVTGYLLLVMFGRQGWLGAWFEQWLGLRFVFTWKGAALASGIMAFPLMLGPIRLAFSAIDPRLELASRTLGANAVKTFIRVALPLARPGIIAGCVLAFARSLGEFGATMMIAGNIPGETRTIPLHIYTLLDSPGGLEQSQTLVAVSIVIATCAAVAGGLLERRSVRHRSSTAGS